MNNLTSRIDAIDFTKGILVLLMVAYHALNYLGYDYLPHDYLAFLPASFIMIAGFLVMHVYSTRREDMSADIRSRLATRALKLLAIFIVLNLAARVVWSRNHYGIELDTREFFSNWFDIFIAMQGKYVAFHVLVPISYTLLVSIGILAIREGRWAFSVAFAFGVFAVCALLDFSGHAINNLFAISAGVIGLSLGNVKLSDLDNAMTSWIVLLALIAAWILIVSLDVDNYVSQMFITTVSLCALYSIGRIVNSQRWWVRQVCILGRYSLMAYIVQILLLQWTRDIDRLGVAGSMVKASTLISLVAGLMWLFVRLVDHSRVKFRSVDRLYKSVFA